MRRRPNAPRSAIHWLRISPASRRHSRIERSRPFPQGSKQKPRREPGRFVGSEARLKRSIFLEKARKLLLEPRYATAAVKDLLGAAGPGRVRLGVNIKVQLVAGLAPG